MDFFFKFEIIFWINYNFFKIIVALGLCKRGGGGICADQLLVYWEFIFILFISYWDRFIENKLDVGFD